MSSLQLAFDTAETVGEPRTGSRRFWTGREEMILRNSYLDGGLVGCLEKLPGRSAQAIYAHARKVGLKSPREAKGTRRPAAGTSDHIDALICRTCQNNPDSGSIKGLAKTINRTRQWIRARAIKLGVAVPRFKAPPWHPAEIEIIAEHPHLGPLALKWRLRKAGFERTEVAIVRKLVLLGASMIDPDHYTANGLSKLFGIDAKVVTGWIAKGWLGAARRGTIRTDQQGGDQWWISRDQVRRFVVGSVAVIDFRKLDKVWLVELLAGSAEIATERDPRRWRQLTPGEGAQALADLRAVDPEAVGILDDTRIRERTPPKRVWRDVTASTATPAVRAPFTQIPPPKNRLDVELAQEVDKELAHWLHDLNEDDTARVFVEIRRQILKMKQQRYAAPMEAEVRRDFLAAVRAGSTPEDAGDIAKERHPETCHKIADLLVASMRAALASAVMTG
jgi:hypothetical protein